MKKFRNIRNLYILRKEKEKERKKEKILYILYEILGTIALIGIIILGYILCFVILANSEELEELRKPAKYREPIYADYVIVRPEAIEKKIFEYINKIRVRNGLFELKYDEDLAKVAYNYANELYKANKLTHRLNGTDVGERVGEELGKKYKLVGENLFFLEKKHSYFDVNPPVLRYSESELAGYCVDGWEKSPSHLENILYENWEYTGIGIKYAYDKFYVVQIFGIRNDEYKEIKENDVIIIE